MLGREVREIGGEITHAVSCAVLDVLRAEARCDLFLHIIRKRHARQVAASMRPPGTFRVLVFSRTLAQHTVTARSVRPSAAETSESARPWMPRRSSTSRSYSDSSVRIHAMK